MLLPSVLQLGLVYRIAADFELNDDAVPRRCCVNHDRNLRNRSLLLLLLPGVFGRLQEEVKRKVVKVSQDQRSAPATF